MLKAINVIIGILLSANVLNAQNLMDDLKAVSSFLDTAESVQIEVVCKVFAKKEGELLNTIHTAMSKKGKIMFSSLDDLDIFTNDKYGVYINNEEKLITVISKAKYTARMKSIDNKSIDQFVSWMKKQQTKTSFNPKLVDEVNGIRIYSISNMDEIKELIVSIDVVNHTIKKISYEFTESSQQKQQFILLDYSKFLVNSKDIHLNQSDYYIQQSGKFFPGNKYKSYSITTDL